MSKNRDILDAGSHKQLPLRLTHGQNGRAASRQTELVVDQSPAVGLGYGLSNQTSASGLPEGINGFSVVHTGNTERREIGADRGFHMSHVVRAAHDDEMMMSS